MLYTGVAIYKQTHAVIKHTTTAPTNQGQWSKYLNSSSLTSILSSLGSCVPLNSVSFIANRYFKMFTNRLTTDTKIEVAENQRLVLLPTSEFRAFALLGVI